MKPQVKVFTRDNPCTKKDIWECFTHNGKFRDMTVPEAQAIIGKNVPRVMERNGHLIVIHDPKADRYRLTGSGQQWAINGINAFLKNHPQYADEVQLLDAKQPGVRRLRTAKTP